MRGSARWAICTIASWRKCGLAAAVAITRLLSFLLFEISALDPSSYLAGSLVLLIAAALASYVPALQTTSVDPIEALRAE